MNRLLVFIMTVCFCFSNLIRAHAQQNTITGTVKNAASGEALGGVNVLVKGTQSGTQTDDKGDFSIKVKGDATLIFSYVGFVSQEVKVSGDDVINIKLEQEAKVLDQVVVVGYGTQKKADVTGSIAQVKGDALVKSPTTSPMSALQGKVAGVQIVNTGAPGSAPTVRIRGVGAFSNPDPNIANMRTGASNTTGQPLYVVDGMLFDDINFLNNNDIQDMSVLKDASAAAIYGVRAANGVVVITTKKGTINRPPTLSFDTYVGVQKASNLLKMANSSDYATMFKEIGDPALLGVLKNSAVRYGGDTANLVPGVSTNWFDQTLRSAMIQSYNLDLSGGTSKATYSFGGTYLNQDGILNVDNKYQRINFRGKADFQVTDFLKIGMNVIVSNSARGIPNNNAMQSAFVNAPIYPVYDSTKAKPGTPIPFASPQDIGLSSYFGNPMAELVYKSNVKEKITRILPGIYADVNLWKTKLIFRTAFNQDLSFGDLRQYTPQYYVGAGQQAATSVLRKENNNYKNYVWDNTLTFRNSYLKHNYSVMVGNSLRSETYRYLMVQANNVPSDKEEYLYIYNGNGDGRIANDYGTRTRAQSYFGRVTYDYDGTYLLTATMRADGTSKYQDKWGYFPSVGLGWVATRENFMKSQKVIDFLKIRASWGKLGNDKIRANDGFASITGGQANSGVFGNALIPGYTNTGDYSTLGWEVVAETDLGLELRTLKNRLSFDFDYYHRLTENAVIANPIPNRSGTLLKNSGRILNEGFEFNLGWNDNLNKNFSYYVNANLATLKNKITSLAVPYIYSGTAEFRQINMIGQALDAFYGYQQAGIYQNQKEIDADPIAVANGLKPGDMRFVDQNHDGKLDGNDRIVMGSYLPKYTYGFNIGFNYKAFDFSASFTGVSGAKIANLKRGVRRWQSSVNYDEAQVKNRWHGEGTSNLYPSAAGSVNPWNTTNFNTFYIEDASYFRVQNIQLGYTLDNRTIKKLKKGTARIYATAERPFTSFKANAFTPEVANGVDQYIYPITSMYTFGVKVTY